MAESSTEVETTGGARRLGMTVVLLALAIASSPARAEPEPAAANGASWSYAASLFGYFVPDDRDYAQPTLAADRGRLHLEARYNYEALETGSAWLGYAFRAGEQVRMDLTPMVGAAFGDLRGVAPGYELAVEWSRLALYSEGEYFLGVDDESEDFFYNWSELSFSTGRSWRAGIALQRTRAYETGLDLQRGLLAGVSLERVDMAAHVFNLGWEDPTVVVSAVVEF